MNIRSRVIAVAAGCMLAFASLGTAAAQEIEDPQVFNEELLSINIFEELEDRGDYEPGRGGPDSGDEQSNVPDPGDMPPGDGGDEPVDSVPGYTNPGSGEPGNDVPVETEPGDEEPGDVEPDDEEPGIEQPDDEDVESVFNRLIKAYQQLLDAYDHLLTTYSSVFGAA